jgi:superfamily I DNA and RNA helicase
MIKTYSFQDVSVTFSHPSVGQYVATGSGIGSINITMANDKTTHDTAADGNVMISKIKTRNGSIALSIQQVSWLNTWLTKWLNYLETAGADEWAQTKIVVRAPNMGETITAVGVTPQKMPDRPYQAQGQQVTWNLMAGDIQQDAAY